MITLLSPPISIGSHPHLIDRGFNFNTANTVIQHSLHQHNITVAKWLPHTTFHTTYGMSEVGNGYRQIHIPIPVNTINFCICLHEIKHILMYDEGENKRRFEEEYECEMFAIQQADKLKFDTTQYKGRVLWHLTHKIAQAHNRGLDHNTIPIQIKKYLKLNNIDLSKWEGMIIKVTLRDNLSICIKGMSIGNSCI